MVLKNFTANRRYNRYYKRVMDKEEKRIAVFPGSFDPFTIGHKEILDRALPLFDKVIVLISCNSEKSRLTDIELTLMSIKNLYKDNPKVEVKLNLDSLTVDKCFVFGAKFIIRGLRNPNDFAYEQPIAQMNKEIEGIETVFIAASPEMSNISSSIVKEYMKYGVDMSKYIPK